MLCQLLLLLAWGTVTGNVQLDLEQLSRLGIDAQLLEQLRTISSANYGCGLRENNPMMRRWLRNTTVTCNDGTPAG